MLRLCARLQAARRSMRNNRARAWNRTMSLHRKLSTSIVLLGTLLFTPMLPAQNPAADLATLARQDGH